MYGLIIKKQWLDKILAGEKTLEIRGSKTGRLGETIALLESGSCIIRGFCKIQEIIPLDEDKWEIEKENHCVDMPFDELTKRYRTPYGWKLHCVISCEGKLTYDHPHGAVVWVDLSKTTVRNEAGEPIDSPNPFRESLKNTIKKMQKEAKEKEENAGDKQERTADITGIPSGKNSLQPVINAGHCQRTTRHGVPVNSRQCGACIAVIILVLAGCYGLSWIVTCGIIKLITMCFGLTFKWSIATGIWLIICLLKSIFNVTVKK